MGLCNAYWNDVLPFHVETEQFCIEDLKKNGLSKWPFEVPILLDRGEIPYLVLDPISLYEMRKRTENALGHTDNGKLVLTNQKLIFVGNNKSISTNLDELLSVDTDAPLGYDGFLQIAKKGKQRIDTYLVRMPNLTRDFISLACKEYDVD